MSVQRLVSRRTQTQRSLTHTRNLKAAAQSKLERLKQAKVEVTRLIQETMRVDQRLKSFTISSADWQGTTEVDYSAGPKNNMDTAVSNYVDHLNDSSNRIDQEIQRLMSQIDSYDSQISSYSRTISNLNVQIRNLRSG